MTSSGFGGAVEGRGTDPGMGASTLLLSFPSMDDRARRACGDHLAVDGPDHRAVILVALTETPTRRVERWRATVGDRLPDRLHVIAADDSAAEAPPAVDAATTLTVDTVSSPRDLTGLGIAISNYLDGLGDHHGGIACCFDSLSTLLNYADRQQVFKFLHVLTAQLRSVDATAHFHVDPTAHDTREVRAITALFDTEVAAADDGGIDVRSR